MQDDSTREHAPSLEQSATPDVVHAVMNLLRGTSLGQSCEAVTIVLCELVRAGAENNDAAAVEIVGNVLSFYERFPEPTIKGLALVKTESAAGTVN